MFKVENHIIEGDNLTIDYYKASWKNCNTLSLPLTVFKNWIIKGDHNITDYISLDGIVDIKIPVDIFVEENRDDVLVTQFINEYLRDS